MKSKYKFKEVLDIINRIETFFIMILLAIMVGISVLEIIVRVLLGHSFVWIYPTSLLLFSWMVFIGAAVVFYRKEYIVIEYFIRLLSSNHQRYANIIVNFAVMGFFIFLLTEAPTLIEMKTQEMQVIHIPLYVKVLPLFIGSFSVLLNVFYDTLILIKGDIEK